MASPQKNDKIRINEIKMESTLNRTEIENEISNKDKLTFYNLKNKVLVSMEVNSEISFFGKLKIKVIHGSVNVYGYKLTATNASVNVYSPRGHGAVVITACDTHDIEDVSSILSQANMSKNAEWKLRKYIAECNSGIVFLMLENFDNKLTTFLNYFYPIRLFPKIEDSNNYVDADIRKAEITLQCNFHFSNSDCRQLNFDSHLNNIAESISCQKLNNEWSCALVAGGKGVGKSTTVRFLINRLLATSPVVLVDLDPGQTECTPASCISFKLITHPLLGPNFTHLEMPNYQIFIEDVNVSNCLLQYLGACKKLIESLKSNPEFTKYPVIVNTMGFTNGIGWDIAVFILKLIKPSLVLQILSNKAKNNFCNHLSPEIINEQEMKWESLSNDIDWNKPFSFDLECINSEGEKMTGVANEMWNMEPYQKRELMMTAYLSDMVEISIEQMYIDSDLGECVKAAIPFQIPLSLLYIALPKCGVSPRHVLSVINGNVVALCGIDEVDGSSTNQQDSSYPTILTRVPLCACFGFGIVRGIDLDTGLIYINTPLPLSVMRCVNCLIGCIPIPQILLKINRPGDPYVEETGNLPTSREPRRGYFRMKNRGNKSGKLN